MADTTRNPLAGPLTAADLDQPVTWGRPGRDAWPQCNGACKVCICRPPLDAEDELGQLLAPAVRMAVSVALVALAAAGVLALFPNTFGG